MVEQLALLNGYYRCHNCGRDVDRVHRVRRWRLCDECYAAIVEPSRPGETPRDLVPGDELWQAREQYWQLIESMERRYPSPAGRHRLPQQQQRTADSYYPWCECGQLRPALRLSAGQPGLWGGPFMQHCPTCEGRETVRYLYQSAPRLMPGRDDEEWLDLLLTSHPELFASGILPDYWFELKVQAVT